VPTPVTITGARGTGNVSQANRKVDIKDRVLELQPNTTPFVILADKLPSKVAVNPQFSWFEEDLEPRYSATSGAVTNVATAVPVTAGQGAWFAQHDMVFVPRTGEMFRVVSIATDTLTVVRGVGSTATAMNSGEELLITGSAQPEGDTSKPARSGVPTQVTNYTQIFREPWESTETWMASETFAGPDDWQRQTKHKGIEHRKEIEYAYLVGRPSEDLTGSQPRRTTGGARHFIVTNVTDAGGTMTEATFWSALRPIFRFGSQEKLALGAAKPIQITNQYALNKIQIHQGDSTYGLKVMQYVSPFGTLNMVVDYQLEGTTLSTEMVILDMEYLTRRYMTGRDTHVKTNIQAPDADTRKDEFLTEGGLEFGQEKCHGRITNITG
jgi:hypothetical protein